MITDTTLASEYATKPDEWRVEHVTAPRNSCAGMLKFRRALMGIMPGYAGTIAGLYIKRLEEWDQYRYTIRGNEVSLAEATGILEGRLPVPKYPPRPPRKRKTADTTTASTFALVSPQPKPRAVKQPRAKEPVKLKPITDLPMFAGQGTPHAA